MISAHQLNVSKSSAEITKQTVKTALENPLVLQIIFHFYIHPFMYKTKTKTKNMHAKVYKQFI